ncbi:MAG: cysteine hydrolase family protein [Solirubrobacteraceae bacterium]
MTDSSTAPQFDAAALITIDVQRDLLDDGGFPIAGTSATLPSIGQLLQAFRDASRPIVHVVRLYERDGSNAELCRRDALAAGGGLVIRDTDGCQLATELLPSPELRLESQLLMDRGVQSLAPHEVAIYKPRWGAFYATALETHLCQLAVSTLVFCGCNFPNCPRASIYEASERDFRIVAVRDAISGLYERDELELYGIGVVLMTAGEVAGALRSAYEGRAATVSPTIASDAAAAM